MPGSEVGTPTGVGFLLDTLQVGGTEVNAFRVASALDRTVVRLEIASLQGEGPLLEQYRGLGLTVATLGTSATGPARPLQLAGAVAAWARSRRVALVHAHGIYANVFGIVPARLAGVTATVATRRWYQRWQRRDQLLLEGANRVATRLASRVLVNAPSLAADVHRETGAPLRRIVCIPNLVPDAMYCPATASERTAFRQRHGIPEGALLVGVVANLHPIKDHATLLRAFQLMQAQLPSSRLVIVGEGSQRDALGHLASDLGIAGAVLFLGTLRSPPNVHGFFDLAALASRSEGSPNALLEAMAAGRPIVATRVGGIPDLVEHGVSGLLVPPGDHSAMAEALVALGQSPERRDAMGRAGRQSAERHTTATIAQQHHALYRSLLGPSSG